MIQRKISPAMSKSLQEYFVRQYIEYRDSVLSGGRLAGAEEIRMVERQ